MNCQQFFQKLTEFWVIELTAAIPDFCNYLGRQGAAQFVQNDLWPRVIHDLKKMDQGSAKLLELDARAYYDIDLNRPYGLSRQTLDIMHKKRVKGFVSQVKREKRESCSWVEALLILFVTLFDCQLHQIAKCRKQLTDEITVKAF